MDALLNDLRFALRRLVRDRGFAFAAATMLALGLAACVTAFSVLKGVVLASLPYPGGDRVVVVRAENPASGATDNPLTPAEAFALAADPARGAARTFDRFGYWLWGGGSVVDPNGEPRELSSNIVSLGFFPTLGVEPQLGRWFNAEDYATGRNVTVLSFTEWQRLFGGSADAIGKTFTLNDRPYEVVGVMPPEFRYPSRETGLWLPTAEKNFEPDRPAFRFARYVNGIGLVRDGERPGGIAADGLKAITATVHAEQKLSAEDAWRMTSMPLLERIVGEVRWVLWATFGIALLVLVLACSNVAILLSARLSSLRHELAVTQALGASMARLTRTLLLELGVLALAALAAGAALAFAVVEALRQLADGTLARADGIAVDGAVLAVAAGLSMCVPLLVVVLGRPAHGAPSEAIRAGGRGMVGARLALMQRALPGLGIALSTVALVAALALTASLMKLAAVDPGFRTDLHVVQLFRNGGPAEWTRFAVAAKAELAAVPGVESVAVTTAPPLSRIGSWVIDVQVPGRERGELLEIGLRRIDADYIEVVGAALLRGRGIGAEDRAGGVKVAVVNSTFAAKVFPGEDPLGKAILLPIGDGEAIEYQVVGVVADQRNAGLGGAPDPEILIAFDQHPWVGMAFLVDSALPREQLVPALRAAIWRVDPREAITREYLLGEDVDDELAPVRFFAKVVGGFALVALALAAFGVYSLLSFRQRQRTPEFGVRLALGAPPRAVLLQVLREALTSTAAGLALGLVAAFAVLTVMVPRLGLEDRAWLPFSAAAITMLLAVLGATLAPALRAARTDPMTALHYE